jgi:hypothetical protein
VIRLQSSLRSAGSRGTDPQKKSHGVKSGDRGGHRINASSSCPVTTHVYWTPYLLLLSSSGKPWQLYAWALKKTRRDSFSIGVRITMIRCIVYLLWIFQMFHGLMNSPVFMSSMNNTTLAFWTAWGKSFINNKDKTGSKTEPWGTPYYLSSHDDVYVFIFEVFSSNSCISTNWVLSVRYVLIHECIYIADVSVVSLPVCSDSWAWR